MQSIQHQSEQHIFFFFATGFSFFCYFKFCFFIAKRTMVLYNLNMVHVICKAYSKYTEIMERKRFGTCYHCQWHWGTFKFSAWFHPVFCIYSQAICSELNLKLTYGIGRHYLLWLYTHILCSEQSHCKTNQSIFSLLMNCDGLILCLMTKGHWPTFTSSCSTYRFCCCYFSVTEMPLYFQLLSALFSSLSHFVLRKIKSITYISEFGAFLFLWCASSQCNGKFNTIKDNSELRKNIRTDIHKHRSHLTYTTLYLGKIWV